MKRLLFTAIALIVASAAGAATYTFNTNATQETRLTRLRTLLNARGESYADNQALVTDVCGRNLVQMYSEEEGKDIVSWISVINSLSQAQREALCTAAGRTLSNGRCQ